MYFWWVLVSIRLLWEGGRNIKQLCEVGLTLSQLCLKIAPAIAEHWLGVDFKYCRIMELSSRHIIGWILNAVASFSSTEVKIRWQWWAVWLHQPVWINTPTTPGLPPPRMDKPSISHSAARISPPENLQILCWTLKHQFWFDYCYEQSLHCSKHPKDIDKVYKGIYHQVFFFYKHHLLTMHSVQSFDSMNLLNLSLVFF